MAQDPSSPARSDGGRSGASGRSGGGHHLMGVLSWSVLALTLGVGIFYGWRTSTNHQELTQRNLRELDRIGRAVEGRVAGFAAGMSGWYQAQLESESAADSLQALIPGLRGRPGRCGRAQSGVTLTDAGVRFCSLLARRDTTGRSAWWSAEFSLDSLRQSLQTELFDATFVADSSRIFLSRGPAGLRLDQIPSDTGKSVEQRVSTVRSVTIGGRDYRMFLQPLSVRTTPDGAVDSLVSSESVRWTVGGLVAAPRFRAEAFALEPRHLIFLGLLVVLTVLALPFLRTALIGGRESIRLGHVYMMSLSLAMATGLLGIALADVHYFGPVSRSIDRNLAAASGRLAGAFETEIGRVLDEMDAWEPTSDARVWGTRILDTIPGERAAGRYFHFQMMFWVCGDGEQAHKLTPRSTNTPPISVSRREYFRRIRDGGGYAVGGDAARRYFIESIRSGNTGEKIAMISAPYTWPRSGPGAACSGDSAGVRVTATRLAALDAPVLPPGVRFALIRPDGLTLFHSNPERVLEENFITETADDPQVRALLASRDSGLAWVNYMGRYSRVHIRPAGDSLSLALVLDESVLGTAHFESIFISLAVFLGWVLLLLAAFLVAEVLLPGRLHWAWPDRQWPGKYRLLAGLLGGYAALLVLQVVLTLRYWIPVEPGSFIVALQALATALLVQAAGWPDRSVAWSDARIIGWVVLGGATLLQLLLHLRAPFPGVADDVLLAAQLGMVVFAARRIVLLYRSRREPQAVGFQTWYVLSIALTLGVTALGPAYLLHQESVRQQRNRLIHFEQSRLQDNFAARDQRIRAMNRRLRLPASFDASFVADEIDLVVPPVLSARLAGSADGACSPRQSALARGVFARVEKRMPFVSTHAVTLRQLGGGIGGASIEACGAGTLRYAGGPDDTTVAADAPRSTYSRVPAFGRVSAGRLLYLAALLALGWFGVFALGRWFARRVFLLDVPDSEPLALSRHLPPPAAPGHLKDASVIAVCTRSMDRARFRHDNQAICYIDLLQYLSDPAGLVAALSAVGEDRIVVLDHFDHRIEEPAWSDRLLIALEDHVWLRDGTAVLLTSRDPGALFTLQSDAAADRRHAADRWTRLLGQFVTVAVADLQADASGTPHESSAGPGDDQVTEVAYSTAAQAAAATAGAGQRTDIRRAAPHTAMSSSAEPGFIAQLRELGRPFTASLRHLAPPPLTPLRVSSAARGAQVLDSECRGNRRLEAIAAQVRRRPDFARLSPQAVIEQVREMADTFYLAKWAILAEEEQVVVAQLAYGVVVNPSCSRAVRRLLARRIVVRDPELRLMNHSFRQFVRERVSPADMAAWERDAPSSQWQKLRFPLMLGLITIIAFLFVTQRNAFNSAMAVITAAGVSTTAILKLLSTVRWPGRAGE